MEVGLHGLHYSADEDVTRISEVPIIELRPVKSLLVHANRQLGQDKASQAYCLDMGQDAIPVFASGSLH